MKQPMQHLLRILLRLLIVCGVDAVAMLVTIKLLPGVTVTGAAPGAIATAAALLPAGVFLWWSSARRYERQPLPSGYDTRLDSLSIRSCRRG
jgi:hypothetical protein